MMKKNLITEINRYRELMGLDLISEQWPPKTLTDDVAAWLGKFLGRVRNVSAVFEENANKIRNFTKDPNKYPMTEDEIASAWAKMIDESAEFGDYIIPKILNSLDTDTKLAFKEFKQNIRDYTKTPYATKEKAKETIDWFATPNKQTGKPPIESERLRNIIRKDLEKFIDEEFANVAKLNKPPTPKASGNYIRTTSEETPETLTTEKLKQLNRLNRGFWSKTMKFMQTWVDTFTGYNKLLDETLVLINSYRNYKGDAQAQGDIMDRILTNVETIARKEKQAFDDLNRWIDNEIAPHDSALASELRRKSPWRRAESLMDGTMKAEWIKTHGTGWQRTKNLWKQFFSLGSPTNWFGPRFKTKWAPNSEKGDWVWGRAVANKWAGILKGPEFKEFRAWATSLQTKNLDALRDEAARLGLPLTTANLALNYIYGMLKFWGVKNILEAYSGMLSETLGIEGEYIIPIVSGEAAKKYVEVTNLVRSYTEVHYKDADGNDQTMSFEEAERQDPNHPARIAASQMVQDDLNTGQKIGKFILGLVKTPIAFMVDEIKQDPLSPLKSQYPLSVLTMIEGYDTFYSAERKSSIEEIMTWFRKLIGNIEEETNTILDQASTATTRTIETVQTWRDRLTPGQPEKVVNDWATDPTKGGFTGIKSIDKVDDFKYRVTDSTKNYKILVKLTPDKKDVEDFTIEN